MAGLLLRKAQTPNSKHQNPRKSEIRNPKSETNPKHERKQIQNEEARLPPFWSFGFLNFGLPWNLVLGIWNFLQQRASSSSIQSRARASAPRSSRPSDRRPSALAAPGDRGR